MIIQIDATKISHELAISDIHREYSSLTRQMVESVVDDTEKYPSASTIRIIYRDRYDYYFEILTNHAL